MKYLIITLVTLFHYSTAAHCQPAFPAAGKKAVYCVLYQEGTWRYADSASHTRIEAPALTGLEIPKTNPKDCIISHTAYSLLFSDRHKQAGWVAYELTREETNKAYDRTDRFITDPEVKTGTATDSDYAGSGFDRGHLAPAADMGWSSTSMAESFYYSNMSPQTPGFNRGIWKKLEELVRTWAIENKAIYIVTGPVLTNGLQSIGPNRVSVPAYFYKVILDYTAPGIRGIGFIIPNTSSTLPLQNYAVTIDSVEKFTGIDFYPALPDQQEQLIEKSVCITCWSWKSIKTGNSSGNSANNTASVQCQGKTKAGAGCRNNTKNVSGYCYLHENQQRNNSNPQVTPGKSAGRSASVQCSGTTKAGNRCKRMTYSANGRCFQHGGD